eukprot:TRINITY_DN23519_c1_g8_i1.p1 TRINITY_DN23519_c1_g8~~TRINITY_DN23519_c1_g8_i1.p1  ORF type:complete len:566 (-),score=127.90 TRINITY_DN23519_c1_g8_i1:276-1973(-)
MVQLGRSLALAAATGVPPVVAAAEAPVGVVVAFVIAFAETADVPLRGVSPVDQSKYEPIVDEKGEKLFRCFNDRGESGTGSADPPFVAPLPSSLPIEAVNDDFCDCPDGSDEPGTGACAGQNDTLFYCPNAQSSPLYVYTSRVNDGVCDCCDGSDEWGKLSSKCVNTCVEDGRVRKQELDRREKEFRGGVEKRKKLLSKAQADREANRQELAKLENELVSLEAAQQAASDALAEARRSVDEERRRSEKHTSEPATSASSPNSNISSDGDTIEGRVADGVAGDTGGASSGTNGGDTLAVDDVAETKAVDEDGPIVSEYAKWMEGSGALRAKAALPTLANSKPKLVQKQTVEPVDEDLDDDWDDEASADDEEMERTSSEGVMSRAWQRVRKTIVDVWRKVWGKTGSPAERVRDAAEEAHKRAKASVEASRNRIKWLQKQLGGPLEDDENTLAYSSLDGRCITQSFGEYKYEVCFFSEAKQDSTSLGKWKRWETSDVGLFDGGSSCPGGPQRTLRVRFECGTGEELVRISEPSRCTYEASMMHPGACTQEAMLALEKARGPRMPTDEL